MITVPIEVVFIGFDEADPDVVRQLTALGWTPPGPVIEEFDVRPRDPALGSPVTASWATRNAVTVTLDGVAVGPSGTHTWTPSAEGQHTVALAATGLSGLTVRQTVAFFVQPGTVPPPPPPAPDGPRVEHFSATPTRIARGDPVVVKWMCPGATKVQFAGLTFNEDQGEFTHRPEGAGGFFYYLRASDDAGRTADARAEVWIDEAPPPQWPHGPVTATHDLPAPEPGQPVRFKTNLP